jgi:hypothetical protein
MNYIKYCFIVAAIGLVLTSCDDEFLNPIPTSSVVANDYFSSDSELLSGVYSMYDGLQGVNENTQTNWTDYNRGIQFEYLVTEMRSDNTRSQTTEGSKADFHRYLVNANNVEVEDYYASMYEIIFRANSVLNFVDVANPANLNTYTGEAQFMRAYAYFNLVRLFGAVPLVTTTVNPGDDIVFKREAVATIYEQIVSDLTDAVSLLDNDGPKARASKGAAQALLAKAYLSQPSPNYTAAQSLCEDIINGGKYRLLSNFNDVFYSERNEELIFIVEFLSANANESQSFSSEFTFSVGRQDGLNIPEPGLLATLDAKGGNRTQYAVAQASNGFYECAKYFPDGFDGSQNYGPSSRSAGNDWIILRYADVLLMHAEAVLAGAQTTTSSNALASVNEVRARAGLDDITGTLTATDLLAERRVELAFENHRLFDLMRFGVASSVLSAYAAERGYDFNINQLLLPIPAREINLSRGVMSQNPGY